METRSMSFLHMMCTLLTFCSTHGFPLNLPVFIPISIPVSNLVRNSTTNLDFSPLESTTLEDLELQLVKDKLDQTSAQRCYSTCRTTTGCSRAVHCKVDVTCKPGTVCGIIPAGTCYLYGKQGGNLEPAGTCVISNEVLPVTEQQQSINVILPPELSQDALKTNIPIECHQDPTYINHGAVEQQRLKRPGYPVVIEYQCDQEGEEKYQYLAGSSEALCDDQGDWTLPAMICIPTSCYVTTKFPEKAWYAGDMSHDEKHQTCQAWRAEFPHSHSNVFWLRGSYPDDRDPDAVDNKCRDVDFEGRPWCYTTNEDDRWNYCDVLECGAANTCGRPPYIYGTKPVNAKMIGQELHVTYECQDQLTYESGGTVSTCDMETGEWTWSGLQCYSKECFFYERNVQEKGVYQGNVSTTVGGKTCQRWDSQSQHSHDVDASYFPEGSSDYFSNLCRDFKDNFEGAPWCYTTDSDTRWDYCDVPECDFGGSDSKNPSETDNENIPIGCREIPYYLNHGAVQKRKLTKPGYPVVIEYECDTDGYERFEYLTGSYEALCDDLGEWTLPAMICTPTTCYLESSNGEGGWTAWYTGDDSEDVEGYTCRAWHSYDSLYTLAGSFLGDRDPGAVNNKCRTTEGANGANGAWCYTTNPDWSWDWCDVSECEGDNICGRPPFIYGTKPVNAKMIGQELHVTYECQDQLTYESGGTVSTCDMETGEWTWSGLQCYSKECFFYESELQEKGVYQGDVSTTVGGKTCQSWDSQSPHSHGMDASYFPEGSSEYFSNLCRDFKDNFEGAPWCYTADPDTRWDYCDVPECDFVYDEPPQHTEEVTHPTPPEIKSLLTFT